MGTQISALIPDGDIRNSHTQEEFLYSMSSQNPKNAKPISKSIHDISKSHKNFVIITSGQPDHVKYWQEQQVFVCAFTIAEPPIPLNYYHTHLFKGFSLVTIHLGKVAYQNMIFFMNAAKYNLSKSDFLNQIIIVSSFSENSCDFNDKFSKSIQPKLIIASPKIAKLSLVNNNDDENADNQNNANFQRTIHEDPKLMNNLDYTVIKGKPGNELSENLGPLSESSSTPIDSGLDIDEQQVEISLINSSSITESIYYYSSQPETIPKSKNRSVPLNNKKGPNNSYSLSEDYNDGYNDDEPEDIEVKPFSKPKRKKKKGNKRNCKKKTGRKNTKITLIEDSKRNDISSGSLSEGDNGHDGKPSKTPNKRNVDFNIIEDRDRNIPKDKPNQRVVDINIIEDRKRNIPSDDDNIEDNNDNNSKNKKGKPNQRVVDINIIEDRKRKNPNDNVNNDENEEDNNNSEDKKGKPNQRVVDINIIEDRKRKNPNDNVNDDENEDNNNSKGKNPKSSPYNSNESGGEANKDKSSDKPKQRNVDTDEIQPSPSGNNGNDKGKPKKRPYRRVKRKLDKSKDNNLPNDSESDNYNNSMNNPEDQQENNSKDDYENQDQLNNIPFQARNINQPNGDQSGMPGNELSKPEKRDQTNYDPNKPRYNDQINQAYNDLPYDQSPFQNDGGPYQQNNNPDQNPYNQNRQPSQQIHYPYQANGDQFDNEKEPYLQTRNPNQSEDRNFPNKYPSSDNQKVPYQQNENLPNQYPYDQTRNFYPYNPGNGYLKGDDGGFDNSGPKPNQRNNQDYAIANNSNDDDRIPNHFDKVISDSPYQKKPSDFNDNIYDNIDSKSNQRDASNTDSNDIISGSDSGHIKPRKLRSISPSRRPNSKRAPSPKSPRGLYTVNLRISGDKNPSDANESDDAHPITERSTNVEPKPQISMSTEMFEFNCPQRSIYFEISKENFNYPNDNKNKESQPISISNPISFESNLKHKKKASLNLDHKVVIDKFHSKKTVEMSIGHMVGVSKYHSTPKSDVIKDQPMKERSIALTNTGTVPKDEEIGTQTKREEGIEYVISPSVFDEPYPKQNLSDRKSPSNHSHHHHHHSNHKRSHSTRNQKKSPNSSTIKDEAPKNSEEELSAFDIEKSEPMNPPSKKFILPREDDNDIDVNFVFRGNSDRSSDAFAPSATSNGYQNYKKENL